MLRGFFLLSLGVIFYSYEYILRVMPGAMVDNIADFQHLGADQISQFSFFYYIGYTLMQIPVGLLLDRFNEKTLMIVACLLCAVGNFLFLQLDIAFIASLGRVLIGIGSSFAFIGVLQIANHRFSKDNFPLATGIIVALAMMSGFVGDQLLIRIFSRLGFSTTLYGFIAFAFILALLFYLFTPNSVQQYKRNSSHVIDDLRQLVNNRDIIFNALCGGLLYMPLAVFAELWGIRFFHHHTHLTLAEATNMNTLLFLGWTIGAPLLGWVAGKKNIRHTMKIACCFSMIFVLSIVFYQGNNILLISFLVFFFGFCSAAQILVIPRARDLCEQALQATGMALTNSIVMLTASFSIILAKQFSHIHYVSHYIDIDQLRLLVIPLGIVLALGLNRLCGVRNAYL